MAGGTIWKGSIRFGNTDVAVKLHSAVKEDRIQFHLLHRDDQVRLKQRMVCALEKKPVSADEQVKGFEVEKDKYLLLDPGELEQAEQEGTRTIEVHEFVKREQIDPLFFDRVYYLEPDATVTKGTGYAALVGALQKMDAIGICTWTMRKRSYFGAVQAAGNVLRLSTLRHADEVILPETLGLQGQALHERELEIGSELIGKLSAPFSPGRFRNEHQNKLQQMIDKKARGEKIALQAAKQLEPTSSDDLLKMLEASLKKAA